ncbi:MAG: hypothetical protein U0793_25260 [Gemmataceae bacterium]
MRRFIPGKKSMLGALGALAVLGGLALWQKDRLLAWYHVRQLAQADDASREERVKQVVAVGQACVGGLVDRLTQGDEAVCVNMEDGLVALGLDWGRDDPRTQELLRQVHDAFTTAGVRGRVACLNVTRAIIESRGPAQRLPAEAAKLAANLLERADAETNTAALRLARAFLERVPPGEGSGLCRVLALKGLGAGAVGTRLAALGVVVQTPFKKDQDLLQRVVPLLKDKEARIRKAALVALAGERDLVPDDDLILLLHDPDLGVQDVCEQALRSRGLQDSHILLARLISDDDPAARLQVLDHLHRAPDLAPGVWLERLTRDPAPAVRAAAVRAAAGAPEAGLRSRLGEMARGDASPTVRQLAVFYLTKGARRRSGD